VIVDRVCREEVARKVQSRPYDEHGKLARNVLDRDPENDRRARFLFLSRSARTCPSKPERRPAVSLFSSGSPPTGYVGADARGIRADERKTSSRPSGIRISSPATFFFPSRGEKSGVEEREEGHRPGSNVTGKSGRTAAWVDKSQRSREPTFSRKPNRHENQSQGLSVEARAGWEDEEGRGEGRRENKVGGESSSWSRRKAKQIVSGVENVGERGGWLDKERGDE
jgi:hypothetical protein